MLFKLSSTLTVCALATIASELRADADIFVDPRPLELRMASFPWDASFSPDGRWVAIVAGYEKFARIHEAGTLKAAWSSEDGVKGWTHRGAFTADSRRFITIGGGALLVVELGETGWSLRDRFELGFAPALGALRASPRSISLSADGAAAVFVDAGRVWRVDLRSGAVRQAVPDEGAFSAFLVGPDKLAISTTTPFATRVLGPESAVRELRGIVLLQPSPDGSRWLVAPDESRFDLGFRGEDREYRLYLEMRSVADQATLGKLELRGIRQEEYNHRLLLQAAFSADASLVVTVEGDGLVTIRDGATLAAMQRLTEYATEQYAMGAALAPDASLLLTGGRREGPGVLMWRRAAKPEPDRDRPAK